MPDNIITLVDIRAKVPEINTDESYDIVTVTGAIATLPDVIATLSDVKATVTNGSVNVTMSVTLELMLRKQ